MLLVLGVGWFGCACYLGYQNLKIADDSMSFHSALIISQIFIAAEIMS